MAEASQYRATASGAECEQLLRSIQGLWAGSRLESLGASVEGRTIWSLVVEPAAPRAGRPLTVLLLGGLHADECDGKEALLALARDYAGDQRAAAPQNLRLIFVPNFNVDGNQRISRAHRPEQLQPESGVGSRTNAQNLDLGLDFVKLEAPETLALVSAIQHMDVDVLIDTRSTDQANPRDDLTYAIPRNPAAAAAIGRWLRDEFLPPVTAALGSRGVSISAVGAADAEHATRPATGDGPRHSIELMGLRGKIGLRVESHAAAPYERRVDATRQFVSAVLTALDGQAEAAGKLVSSTAAGNPRRGTALPIASAPAAEARDVLVPYAYAVAPQYAWALSRLHRQGIQIDRLAADVTDVRLEAYTITHVKADVELENHRLRKVTADARAGTRNLSAGTYVIRTAQPLGALAAYLLEPQSEDGLAAWNFFDPDLVVGTEAPVVRVLKELPAEHFIAVHSIAPGERLTLEHLFQPGRTVDFATAPPVNLEWLGQTDQLLVQRDERWWVIDPSNGSSRPSELLAKMETSLAAFDAFESKDARKAIGPDKLTEDARFGLLAQGGDLYFYDVESDSARRLTHTPDENEELAALSPTGEHVAFVRDHDLYLIDCRTGDARRLTSDGSKERLNGILDWVYQEELYGRGNFRAFWFSPDGRHLAFLQLDQSPVLHYQVSDSISYRQNLEDTRYPKAGDPLPVARVWIADIDSGQLREVDLAQFPSDDRLVVRVTWSPAGELWLQIQNRVQNQQTVVRVDPASGRASVVIEEKSPGWIEVLGQPKFLPDGDFLWLSDLPDGRRHLSRCHVPSKSLTQLTNGAWDIAEILSVSPDGQTALVTGNLSHPTEVQLIRVDTATGETEQLTQQPGVHRPRPSPSGQTFVDTWSNLQQPPRTVLKAMAGADERVLSAPVSDRYRYVEMAAPQLQTIRARDGLPLHAMVMLPPQAAAGESLERLPVLFYVYGGPQAPTVTNSWQSGNYWWHQYLCSRGFAVVLCDNRSARGRGIADTWKIRGDLGRVELEDLKDAVDWVCEQPWADPERIGIWGWSYGGYFTAYALTHSDRFRAGISGAPVTDWHNYDAIYTERYMDLPQNNVDGYKSSSTVAAAENLHGRLLLLHGERDDNVHLSNTLQLAYALQKAGKPFEMMIYPKNRHGVVDPAQRYHLYQTMTDFLERTLKN